MTRRTVVLLILAAIVVGFLIAALTSGGALTEPAVRLPGARSGWYEIYFTSPKSPDRPEDRRGGLDEQFVRFLDRAVTSVDLAIYDLDLDGVAQALLRARGRGVRVRLVTDSDNGSHDVLEKLRRGGVPVVLDGRSAIMHHKFAVVDESLVWTGSWNFTVYDTYRYDNNAAWISSRDLASGYAAEFEQLFVGRRFGPSKAKSVPRPPVQVEGTRIESYFSPQDGVGDQIVARLRRAARRVDFLAFSFTDDRVGKMIEDRFGAGVKVRGVFETTGSETSASEFARLRRAGADVYQDKNPYLMHNKVFVVDERTVLFGSYNFSRNADESNDENLLVVEDPAWARRYLAEVDRIVGVARR